MLHNDAVLVKAPDGGLSKAVNHGIETELVGEDKPFEGVKSALEEISKVPNYDCFFCEYKKQLLEWKRQG